LDGYRHGDIFLLRKEKKQNIFEPKQSGNEMRNAFHWVSALLILVICISCKKSDTTPPVTTPDTTVPVITLTDPVPGKSYVLGTALHLQMDLSDNVELKSYRVTITRSLKGVQTSDWGFSQTWSIAAGKKTLTVNHNEITVPLTVTGNQTTTGNYDFTVYCTDSSNNEASKTFLIVLTK
jgi:hypothetical protein